MQINIRLVESTTTFCSCRDTAGEDKKHVDSMCLATARLIIRLITMMMSHCLRC